jgi:hypothetical protein
LDGGGSPIEVNNKVDFQNNDIDGIEMLYQVFDDGNHSVLIDGGSDPTTRSWLEFFGDGGFVIRDHSNGDLAGFYPSGKIKVFDGPL